MADFVASAEFQDNLSAGMNSATATLLKAADAADKVEASVTRAGASADALTRRYDPAAAMASKLEAAQRRLAEATATMDAAVANGSKTLDQRNVVVEGASARVQALTAAMNATGPAGAAMVDSHGKAADAAGKGALAHAGFTREIVVLGHEVVTGNFARIPGSMIVLAERSGELTNIIKTLGGVIFGLPGIALAATAGLAYLGYEAETQQRQMLGLQAALRATRDDYAAMADEATRAARAVAGSTGFSLADSKAATKEITSVPAFIGDQAQLRALVLASGDLATVMGVTLPEAAKTMAAAMKDPAKIAQEWADTHSFGMTQAMADHIKIMQEGGDKAGAFGADLDQLKAKSQGAAEVIKTDLQKAIEELDKAFTSAGSDGKSLGDVIGRGMQNVAATAVEQIAEIVNAVKGARDFLVNPAGTFGGNQSGISTQAYNQIQDIAERGHFSSAQADLAVKIARQESGGHQFNDDGSLKSSSAGAVGIMGLMPGTAADMGVNPADQAGNVQGGLKYISQLWAKYGGDPALVAMAYNWGQGNVDKFLDGRKTIGDVPAETKAYVQSVAGASINSIPTHGGAIDVSAKNGVANSSLVDDALKRIGSSTTVDAAAKAAAYIKDDTAALAALAAQGDTSSVSVQKLNEDLIKQQVALQNAKTPADALVASLGRQADGQDKITAAYGQGGDAVTHATNLVRAEEEARKMAGVTTENYFATVIKLASGYDALTASQQRNKAGQQEADQRDQLALLQEETRTVGESADARSRDLAIMKERQAIQKTMPDLDQAEKDKLVANAAAIADATSNLQRQQQAVQEIGNMLTQAFDQVGQAITNAFISGNGAAVNWGNVTRGVITSVLQEVLKLAVINPLLNSVIGGSRTTITDAAGALGAGSGTGGSGAIGSIGSGLSLISTGKSIYSAGQAIYSGGAISPAIDAYAAGLAPSLFGAAPATEAQILAANSISGAYGGGTAGSAGLIGSASGVLAGAGLGFTAGSFIGGAVQSAEHKTGPAPEVGAGVGAVGGAVAGAIIGSAIPVVGTLIGGIIGGLIGGGGGGALGGLIGPHTASVFSTTPVTVGDGSLQFGKTIQQGVDEFGREKPIKDQNDQLTNFLIANGLAATSQTGPIQIGVNNPGGFQDPTKFLDLNTPNVTGHSALSQIGFSSSNATVDTFLKKSTFGDIPTLEKAVGDVVTFVQTTVPALIALGKSPTADGTFSKQMDDLNAAFKQAVTNAGVLGMSTTDLSKAWKDSTTRLQDAQTKIIAATDAGFVSRFKNAAASISGSPTDALNAQLYTFDASAVTQRDQLSQSLVTSYGDAFKASTGYAEQMALLEKTLGEERLSIQHAYNDKLTATATTSVTSLAGYVLKLQSGATSPLSPAAQYALASSQFNADTLSAKHGNFAAVNSIQSYADTLLTASRAQNGSGTAYAADFNRVLDVLTSLAGVAPDTLTASIAAEQTQTQTTTLVNALTDVKNEVAALRQQVNAPPRLV